MTASSTDKQSDKRTSASATMTAKERKEREKQEHLNNLQSYVDKQKTARASLSTLDKFLSDMRAEFQVILGQYMESIPESPKSNDTIQAITWLRNSFDLASQYASDVSSIRTRMSLACFARINRTKGVRLDVLAKLRDMTAQALGVSEQTRKQYSAFVAGFPLTACEVTKGHGTASVYRRLTKVASEYRKVARDNAETDHDREPSHALDVYTSDYLKAHKRNPTIVMLRARLTDIYKVNQETQSDVNDIIADDLTDRRTKRLLRACGDTHIDDITDKADEQERMQKHLAGLLRKAGVNVVLHDPADALTSLVKGFSEWHTSANLATIASLLGQLQTLVKKAQTPVKAQPKSDQYPYTIVSKRITHALANANLDVETLKRMSVKELRKIDGIGQSSAVKIVEWYKAQESATDSVQPEHAGQTVE